MHRFALCLGIVCMTISASTILPAHASQCSGLTSLRDHGAKQIFLRKNALLFSTDILKIDIDGSKHAYGIDDQGIEGICNGLSPVSPKRCQNTFMRKSNGCFQHCAAKFRQWHRESKDPKELGKYMRSIGLGGGNGSVPNAVLQPPPNQNFFVSHTSVQYGPWKRGESVKKFSTQEAQLESLDVPFFVIPGKFRKAPWDATPGDFGVAVHAQDPSRYAFFVVGDTGGALDEGSAKLQENLRGGPLPTRQRTNLFGVKVPDYGNLSYTKFGPNDPLDLRVAIFRHSSSYDRSKSGARLVLQDAHSQSELLSQIKQRGQELLDDFGGTEMVVSCTN